MVDNSLLIPVPDWGTFDDASKWVEEGLLQISAVPRSGAAAGRFSCTQTPTPSTKVRRFGLYQDPMWRRAVLATFLADIASYPASVDQVNFERLTFVMHAFPQGFRTFWAESDRGTWWPVGYSGWYPMLASAFRAFEKDPSALQDRMVVPAPLGTASSPYLYIFNYSVAGALRGTALSSHLVKTLAADIANVRPAGLATIAVSSDGCRVASRFGMIQTGKLTLGGVQESVFAGRLPR